MSTPSNIQNAHTSQSKTAVSTGPSTPAGPGNAAPSSAPVTASVVASGLMSQNNTGTPRSNPPTMHPSPANHRSPLNIRSPAAARSVGATPMARVASNASGSGLGASPMQRGHTAIGLKSTGTPGKTGSQLAGKTVPGASGMSGGTGLGIAQPGLSAASPNVNESSPSNGRFGVVQSIAGLGTPSAGSAAGTVPGAFPGGVDMDVSFSGLGFSIGSGLSAVGSSGGGRLDDDERRRRLESVLETLRKRPGRVSREALERLGRRCELDMHMDEDELSLAGKNAVMLEIQFKRKSSLVDRVSVNFPTASDALGAHASKASQILQNDLTPSNGIAAMNASLDRFADNLERLARLDKLSIPGANCFEAVFGVYSSLRKLYEHEKKVAEALLAANSMPKAHEIEMEVMCKRSGSPNMHARKRVGLSLDYWKHRRLIAPEKKSLSKEHDEMQIDGPIVEAAMLDGTSLDYRPEDIVTVIIECEASSPAFYPPIRITDSWVSDAIVKNEEDSGPGQESLGPASGQSPSEGNISKEVDWQEPPPPPISTVGSDPMLGIASTHPTQPQARFVAKFEPALVLPWDVASWLCVSVDANIMQEKFLPEALEQLLLSQPPTEMGRSPRAKPPAISAESPYIHAKRSVLAFNHNGNESSNNWDIRLFPTRTEAAVQVQKLPFSHPRQLIAALPVLRQYVFLSKLLQNTLATPTSESTNAQDEGGKVNRSASSGPAFQAINGHAHPTRNSASSAAAAVIAAEADLDAFLSSDQPTQTAPPRSLDIALSLALPPPQPNSTLPLLRAPRLTIAIPGITMPGTRSQISDPVARVTFTILPNADVDIELEGMPVESAATNGTQDSEMKNAAGEEQDSSAEFQSNTKTEADKVKSAILQAMLVSEDLAIWSEWLRGKLSSWS